MEQQINDTPLPYENQVIQLLRQDGSHLMVLNNLPDEENSKADEIAILMGKKMSEIADELQELSSKVGAIITVKTIISISKGENNNG